MTQGVYRTPVCGLKKSTSSTDVGGTVIGSEFGSPFEKDLINYLETYGSPLQQIRKKLSMYDWSPCKV